MTDSTLLGETMDETSDETSDETIPLEGDEWIEVLGVDGQPITWDEITYALSNVDRYRDALDKVVKADNFDVAQAIARAAIIETS